VPSADRCPSCREKIHPFAAICPSCGTDLDVHRRERLAATERGRRLAIPGLSHDASQLVVVALILLALALFAPEWGALVSLLMLLRAINNSLPAQRNIAIPCAALALLNLIFPDVLYVPHLLPLTI
jgi:hypothetical protein